MEKNVFLRLAEERYTTKHYNGKMIPREQFATLCEILRLAPTSVNAQAWHFFTAHTAEARAKLLPALPDFNHDRVTGASDVVVFTVPTKLTDAHFERVLEKKPPTGAFPTMRSGSSRIRAAAILRAFTWGRKRTSLSG